MKFRELCVILPCHSLEDFPHYHTGEDADSLLACWTALWHPALLADAESPPQWHRADLPPEAVAGRLILVPTVSVPLLPADFASRVREAGGLLDQGERDRSALLSRILSARENGSPALDPELAADYLALGYAYLQVQVLTRQMRYASNLDEASFFQQVMAGARAAAAGDTDTARQKLAAAFDLLAEERDHYYSVDAYLLDLTLLAEPLLGTALTSELGRGSPINLMVTGDLCRMLAEREPANHAAVQTALEQGQLGLVGGEFTERRLPLLSCEGVLAGLRRGAAVARGLYGRPIEVFGRRRCGLTPFLPGVLDKLRFRGALHATLDEGRFPSGTQIKTRWQGLDSAVIDAIAKPPLDAGRPETFLSFAQKLGESMDTDHVATLCLAHWAGTASPWYGDLRRCARHTSALGKFITIDRYFSDTYLPGHLDRYDADQYRTPYLRQDVIRGQPDPISTVMRYWARRVAADGAETTTVLAGLISPAPVTPAPAPPAGELREDSSPSLVERVEEEAGSERGEPLDGEFAAGWQRAWQRLAEALPRQAAAAQPGYLVVNPHSFTRRVGIDVSQLASLPAAEKPVYHVDDAGSSKLAVVDVPPLGYVWVTAGGRGERRRGDEPRLAEDARPRDGVVWLRNEFLEASIHPVTGALQSFKDYRSRGNRLSQQLALRSPGARRRPGDAWTAPDEVPEYSVMAADEVAVTASSTVFGEVRTRGRLLDTSGQTQATFHQVWRLWRGSRTLQLDIELEPLVEPSTDAWNSYYACRFAWSDEAAELYHSVNQTRQRTARRRLEAPLYIELESGERRTTVLTGGIPYHRRVGERMLDTLLIVRGERQRAFRLGIGLDLNQPLPEALSLLTPPSAVLQVAAPPAPANCWLFHIDARSVVATHWSPLREEGRTVGVRVRLLEGSGRNVRARLSAFRPVVSARQVNFLGETLSELPVEQGKVVLDMAGSEWLELEARWGPVA